MQNHSPWLQKSNQRISLMKFRVNSWIHSDSVCASTVPVPVRTRAGGELKLNHVVLFRVGSVKKSQTLCVFASINQSIPVRPAGADTVQRCVTSPNLRRRQKRGWTADVWLNRLVCMSQYCNIEFQLKSYWFHKQVAEMQEEPITNTVNTYCSLQQRGQQVWRICCARA